MRWTCTLGTLAGIRIRLHFSFLLLLAWVLYLGHSELGPLGAALSGSVLVAVFAIIVMHELAHSLTARHFGIGVRDIILLPIGGVARLERLPPNPRQEFLIAAAGPASNFLLALLTAPFVLLLFIYADPKSATWAFGWNFVSSVYFVNLLIGTFNLIPAFPMDGGRILRAALVKRKGYLDATIFATRISRFIAVGLLIIGLMTGRVSLPFVALFVLYAGHQEERMTRRLAILSQSPPQVIDRDSAPAQEQEHFSASPPTAEETIRQLQRARELLGQDPRYQSEPGPQDVA